MVLFVRRKDKPFVRLTKVIRSIGECISQNPVSCCRIVEWIWGRYSSVHPGALIDNLNFFPSMYETAVLCTASVELLFLVARQCLDRLIPRKLQWLGLFKNLTLSHIDRHPACLFFKDNTCLFAPDAYRYRILCNFCLRLHICVRTVRALLDLRRMRLISWCSVL